MMPRHLPLLVFTFLYCGCSNRSGDTAYVRPSSISPPPGAVAVSRRTEVRVVLDVDVDPTSISGASCRLERVDGGVVAPTTQSFEQAARLLTIVPARALAPSTTYRVQLTRELRTSAGTPFANTIEWSFTTDSKPVWERSAVLADGRLLACEPARRGGVLAVWADGNNLQLARCDGVDWWSRVLVGIDGALLADVAEDGSGRVVVAASKLDSSLHVATAVDGFRFGPAELVGAGASAHVEVDASDSGHIAVASAGSVRMFVPGAGWAPSFETFLFPHVRLQPAGTGVAVFAFRVAFPVGGGLGAPQCVRLFGDALGTWTPLDRMPLSTTPLAIPLGSEARFDDDRILLAARWQEEVTPVCEHTPAGWQLLGPVLGADLAAGDIAQGPNGAVSVAQVEAEGRAVLRRRGGSGFTQEFVGSPLEPAPLSPAIGVAITGDQYTHVLWTAAVDRSPLAPVRLMAASFAPGSSASEAFVVEGPFAPEVEPVQNLRVVAFGDSSAVALWSRQGQVHFSLLR